MILTLKQSHPASGSVLVYFVYFIMCLTVHCIVYLEIALRVRLLHN